MFTFVSPSKIIDSPLTVLFPSIFNPEVPYITTLLEILFTPLPRVLFRIKIVPPDIISISPPMFEELVIVMSFDEMIFPGPFTVAPSKVTFAPYVFTEPFRLIVPVSV